MKILLTGGCGAIGSEVVNHLKKNHPDLFIVNLDKLTYAGNTDHIEPPFDNYKFILVDICDVSAISHILRMEQPDAVVHLAAETHVDNSFGNSFAFTHTNVYGTHVLLECVRKHMGTPQGKNIRLFLHMSTDEVYGSVNEDEDARTEDSLFAPSNPYSATKAAAEMICHAYQKSFHIPIVITRCNNAVSKYQNDEKLIPRAVQSIMSGKRVPIHGEGKSKRTFIHAYDIADALYLILQKGKVGEIYNIGTDDEFTVMEVVTKIVQKLKPGESVLDHIEYQSDRPFQDYRYFIDANVLKSLGWSPKIDFEEALDYVIQHKQRNAH